MWRALVLMAAISCTSDEDGPDRLGEGPLYAVMFEIYDDVGSNSYLALLDSLDRDAVDPAEAIEYAGGRAYLQVYGDWIFIGEPSAPIVHRYAVGPDGALQDEQTISFANYGLQSGAIDPWALTFVSPTEAWLFDFREGTHIIWDPTEMAIVGEIPAAPEFQREGLSLATNPGMVRGDRLYRSVHWVDYDTAEYSTEHLLAIYDTDNDQLLELVPETRCPAPGNLTHQDEAGHIYFSNWIWPISGTLLRDAPPSCVLRIPAGSDRFDPDWTLSYRELSGGHEGAMFTHLGDDRGLVAIFDESQSAFDASTDPWELAGRTQWNLWQVDLASGAGAPVEGIPANSGAYTPVLFEDRAFLLVPSGWASTDLYELTAEGAVPGMDIPGWSYAFVQVR